MDRKDPKDAEEKHYTWFQDDLVTRLEIFDIVATMTESGETNYTVLMRVGHKFAAVDFKMRLDAVRLSSLSAEACQLMHEFLLKKQDASLDDLQQTVTDHLFQYLTDGKILPPANLSSPHSTDLQVPHVVPVDLGLIDNSGRDGRINSGSSYNVSVSALNPL